MNYVIVFGVVASFFIFVDENIFNPLNKICIVIPSFTKIEITPMRFTETIFKVASLKNNISLYGILHALLILINNKKKNTNKH